MSVMKKEILKEIPILHFEARCILVGRFNLKVNFGREILKRKRNHKVYLHVQDTDGQELQLGVNHSGLLLYRGMVRVWRQSWPKIIKIAYLRNKLVIRRRPNEVLTSLLSLSAFPGYTRRAFRGDSPLNFTYPSFARVPSLRL